MENFQSLGLPEQLLSSLERMKFLTPTPIQAEAIPIGLKGKDILGSAQTGTGKTGAFGIPLVSWLLNSPNGMALVLTPTRELAIQVIDTLNQLLGKNTGIYSSLLIGGESMGKQLQQLRMKPRLIVGTPGRINDHIERGSLMLAKAEFFVLDEIDRMLDIGLGAQIEQIVKYLPRERQTLMFSATLPQNIINVSQKYLRDPIRISVGSTHTPITRIKQEVVEVEEAGKYDQLVLELNKREGSIIVFVKTKYGAEKLAVKLCRENHSADAMHGDLRQNKRERVINAFRNRKHRIMVATDVAARGLDIPHIEHVINYDMPQCPEDYIHRIGRTARAGAEGTAVNLITRADGSKWRAINMLLSSGKSDSGNQNQPKSRSNNSRGGSQPRGKSFGYSGGGPRSGNSFRKTGEFGARKPRGEFGDRANTAARAGGEFEPRRPRSEFGDRKPREEFGARKPRGEFGNRSASGRPGEFGARKPRSEYPGKPGASFGAGKPFRAKRPRGPNAA